MRDSVLRESPTRPARAANVMPFASRNRRSACVMVVKLHHMQRSVKRTLAIDANDSGSAANLSFGVPTTSSKPRAKRPPQQIPSKDRYNYIAEWAYERDKSQAAITKGIGVDKGTVSRWFNQKVMPTQEHTTMLAEFLGLSEPAALFRHPVDEKFFSVLRHRSEADRERAAEVLSVMFRQEPASIRKVYG